MTPRFPLYIDGDDRSAASGRHPCVDEQPRNVCLTTIVQDAWARGQALTVHGWVYRDPNSEALEPTYAQAVAHLNQGSRRHAE